MGARAPRRDSRPPPPQKGGHAPHRPPTTAQKRRYTDRQDRTGPGNDICLSDCRPYSELIGTRSACTQSSNDHCESRAITSPSRDRCSSQREQSRDSHQKNPPFALRRFWTPNDRNLDIKIDQSMKKGGVSDWVKVFSSKRGGPSSTSNTSHSSPMLTDYDLGQTDRQTFCLGKGEKKKGEKGKGEKGKENREIRKGRRGKGKRGKEEKRKGEKIK